MRVLIPAAKDKVQTNAQVKRNFFRVKEICEKINTLLDKGYLVLDESGSQVESEWRFEFEEPDWQNLKDHCWFREVTKRVSENTTQGYFDPNESLKEHLAYWSKWRALPPEALVKIC